jgi:hypothetical protein
MNSYIQLFSLVSSFIYGIVLYYLNRFNSWLIKDKNIIIKLIISCLYLFNVSLIYVCLLYMLNGGVLHIYNVLFILVGYFIITVKERK